MFSPKAQREKAFIPFNVESHCVLQSWFGKFTFNPLFLVRLQMSLPLFIINMLSYITEKYFGLKLYIYMEKGKFCLSCKM